MEKYFSKYFNTKNFSPFVILYIFINAIFVFKYASRQNHFDVYVVTLLYTSFLIGLITLLIKTNFDKIIYKNSFYILSVIFFIFTIWLNIKVDGNDLIVDRWSAMEVGIKSLLDNVYPFSAVDHLNNMTSNLPTLIFLGMPFYSLGDVGYLQPFSFLIFVFLIHNSFSNNKTRIFGLLLLMSSVSYGWEIYAKSDLMSNFIILLLFIVLVQKRFDSKKKCHLILTAVVSASLLLTRIIAVIPLSLLLFNFFLKLAFKKKVVFIISGVLSVLILFAITFKNYGTIENFKSYNPFELQNNQLPLIISFATIFLPFLYSFYVKNLESLIKLSVVFLSIPIFLSFAFRMYENGVYNSILNSEYDISYFNILTPFLIFHLTIRFNQSVKTISV